jgi:hypothetical protein
MGERRMIYINTDDMKPIRGYVKNVEQKYGMTVASISTSRKDKQTDEYIKSYWDVKFANNEVHEGKITIKRMSIKKEKSPKDGKYYLDLYVLEWEQDDIPNGFQALEEDDEIPAFLR